MSNETSTQQTMRTVMDAFQVVKDFQQSLSDMFRTIGLILEEQDTPYELLDGTIYSASLSAKLRSPSRWNSRHFAASYCPTDDEYLPIFLVNVSVDHEFSKQPEVWLGVVSEVDSAEAFPYETTMKVLFRDFFVPEDEWTETNEWYEESIDDDGVSCLLSFLRFPLEKLQGWDDLEHHVVKRLLDRGQEVSVQDEDEEDED